MLTFLPDHPELRDNFLLEQLVLAKASEWGIFFETNNPNELCAKFHVVRKNRGHEFGVNDNSLTILAQPGKVYILKADHRSARLRNVNEIRQLGLKDLDL